MKKILIFIGLLLIVSSCSVDNSLEDKDEELSYTIKFADNMPETHIDVMANKEFKRLVEERTAGRITIELYPNSEFGDESKSLELLNNGEIQMMNVSVDTLAKYDEKYNVLMLPFLFRDSEHLYNVFNNDILQEFLISDKGLNIVGLSWTDSGPRNLYNSSMQINRVDSFDELIIGLHESGVLSEVFELLGMDIKDIPLSEEYFNLNNGNINAVEGSYMTFLSTKDYEIAKYITEDIHIRVPEMFAINKDFYNSLSKDDQFLLKDCAVLASEYQKEMLAIKEKEAKEKVLESGAIITDMSDEELSKYQEIVFDIYKKYGEDNYDMIDKIISIN